jgi:hypothetical protein
VILGILKRSVPARHAIQNKFAHLYGQIVQVKERNKRHFSHDSALNFTGSISPVRLPDFEADLNALSKVSSPLGSEFLAIGQLYADARSLEVKDDYAAYKQNDDKAQTHNHNHNHNQTHNHNYEHNVDSFNDVDTAAFYSPERCEISTTTENRPDLTNFPTIISPLKRPHRDIEADSKALYYYQTLIFVSFCSCLYSAKEIRSSSK